ncbi:MAG: pyridoxamine 5'-phosphate oxidase family protein [bacterium]
MLFRPLRRSEKQMSGADAVALLVRGREGILGTLGDGGYPYTVVVNYVYFQDKIYFHCAKEGHKIDNIRRDEKVSFSVYDHVEIVGDQLNTHYQSVLVFGKAKVLPATKEILLALIQKYSDMPLDRAIRAIENEIMDTAIVVIDIEHLSGKTG